MYPSGELKQPDGTTITANAKFVDTFNQVTVLNYTPAIRIYLVAEENNSDFRMATMTLDMDVLKKHVDIHGKKQMKKLLREIKNYLDSL